MAVGPSSDHSQPPWIPNAPPQEDILDTPLDQRSTTWNWDFLHGAVPGEAKAISGAMCPHEPLAPAVFFYFEAVKHMGQRVSGENIKADRQWIQVGQKETLVCAKSDSK